MPGFGEGFVHGNSGFVFGGEAMKDKEFIPVSFGCNTIDELREAIALLPEKSKIAKKCIESMPNSEIIKMLSVGKMGNARRFMLRMELFRRLEAGDAVFVFGEITKVSRVHKSGKCAWVDNSNQFACVDDILFLHEVSVNK